MKIAHVVDSMEVGGAETLVTQMCRLQRQQGHDPCVYAVATLGPLGEQLRNEGFIVEPHMGRSLPHATRTFYRIFKESRPDVVHLHNPTPTIYAACAARLAGVPSIVSTRHSLVATPRRLAVELKYAVAATCCDWVVGICDATVANLKSLHTIPARKIVRIYNGTAPLQRVAIEKRPPKSGFTLLYVGRLAPVKNHGLLLHAFQTALSSRRDLRLWMVGDGSERKALENLASELGVAGQVTFWGQQLDVAPFFSAADAFIMSSRSEGLPMSLLQAFSLGLPAIVTDVGGMAEVVRLVNAGIPVSATDPAEMAAAILRIARCETEREQFSINPEEALDLRFSLSTMIDAYMDLYRYTRGGRRQSFDSEREERLD
jgi:glycosyltransferase involved in cell wall biosynthesis